MVKLKYVVKIVVDSYYVQSHIYGRILYVINYGQI